MSEERLEQPEILDAALTILAKQLPFYAGCDYWEQSITLWRDWAIKLAKEQGEK